ncbi:MAG: DUF3489 domain-containing protein [Sphingomonadales bacterium]
MHQFSPPKLTDTQLVILSAAAARDAGALLPMPEPLKLNRRSTTRVLNGLVRKGLAVGITASPDDVVWRLSDDGERLTLVITDQGLAALGIKCHPDRHREVGQKDTKTDGSEKGAQRSGIVPKPTSSKPVTKIGVVIDMLSRGEGATVADLMAVTGWQAHSMRGAMSGTVRKKMGHSLVSNTVEGRGRVYSIATGESRP